jgi:RES domain-containing protein
MAFTDERVVWRLTKPQYAPGLDGEGARLAGGRWNSPGTPVVYCSETLSLAVLESFVHLPSALRGAARLPLLTAVGVELPEEVEFQDLPAESITDLFDVAACREIGDQWLDARLTLALRVPSVIVPQEWNVLINPSHPQATGLRIFEQTEFEFDPRMVD